MYMYAHSVYLILYIYYYIYLYVYKRRSDSPCMLRPLRAKGVKALGGEKITLMGLLTSKSFVINDLQPNP